MTITIGVLKEPVGDQRVALTPPVVASLVSSGLTVVVEPGAGAGASYDNTDYETAGASLASAAEIVAAANVLVCVNRPVEIWDALGPQHTVIGLLDAWDRPDLDSAAARGVTLISLDLLPRQISRAQVMDVLSSQASIAGYRAVIEAAAAYGRYFPMMVTAAGTAKPASVLVLGAGVAGLQAIATARRLGARVTGYDVRPAAQEEIRSLGAQFLSTSVSAADEGGYARALTDEERATQQQELADATIKFDIVITTARVPGAAPPVLVTASTVAAMRRGSVIVDMGASALGGNVEGSVPDQTVVTDGGVTIIGAGRLPATSPAAASDAYAKNMAAVLGAIVTDGELRIDRTDDVIGAMVIAASDVIEGAQA